MADYLKALSLIAEGELKRCYWVQGTSRLLVERSIDAIRRLVNPDPSNYASLECTKTSASMREIHDAINQYPLDNLQKRLVTIRHAQNLPNYEYIIQWLDSRHIPQTHVCFVADGDPDHTELTQRIVKSGRFIDCSPSADKSVEILAHEAQVAEHEAQAILEAVGSLELAMSAAWKAKAIGGKLTPKSAALLETPCPSDDFVDALASMNKAKAMSLIPTIESTEIPKILSFLANRTQQLLTLFRLRRRQLSTREIIEHSGVPVFLLPRLLPLSRNYDRGPALRRLTLIASLDAENQQGAQDGLLEVLVAAW